MNFNSLNSNVKLSSVFSEYENGNDQQKFQMILANNFQSGLFCDTIPKTQFFNSNNHQQHQQQEFLNMISKILPKIPSLTNTNQQHLHNILNTKTDENNAKVSSKATFNTNNQHVLKSFNLTQNNNGQMFQNILANNFLRSANFQDLSLNNQMSFMPLKFNNINMAVNLSCTEISQDSHLDNKSNINKFNG